MEIRPLSDALGAEVIGLDLGAPISDATFEAVHRAFLDHCLLVFRDQNLTPDQHVAFSARFGPLTEHVIDQFLLPGYPQILRISNKKDSAGQNVGLVDAGRYWHSDLSYAEVPSLGSMLYSLEIPPEGKGGDTLFANLRAAYEALPDATKARLDGRKAVYMTSRQRFKDDDRIQLSERQAAATPAVEHPVVRTHPETGRKALFVNPGHTDHIVGMSPAEGRALLEELFAHATGDAFVYRHKWRLRDLVFWDNRCLMHIADPPLPGYDRHMHRTTIEGDRPY
jgi:taurine dioxygenase